MFVIVPGGTHLSSHLLGRQRHEDQAESSLDKGSGKTLSQKQKGKECKSSSTALASHVKGPRFNSWHLKEGTHIYTQTYMYIKYMSLYMAVCQR